MVERIEVIYENGVFRPLNPVPPSVKDRQQFTVTLEGHAEAPGWLADADPTVSLDEVRRALSRANVSGTGLVHAEREERY